MKFDDLVFKAYDIRGVSYTQITPELAQGVGKALADFLPQAGPVMVGRDMRADSQALASAVMAGLTEQGRDVWDIGMVTTDMIYFGVGHYGEVAGGVMVTASHNPGKYNGIKLCNHDAIPLGAEHGLLEIKRLVAEDSYKRTKRHGQIQPKDITQKFVDQIMRFAGDDLKPYKIAVDAGNGMAGTIFPHLQQKLPFNIKQLFFELDGTFPNHVANPHLPETLGTIIEAIKTYKLDFGLAFDGDGDRGVLIDERGESVSEAVTGAILADYFLQVKPGAAVVCDVRTSRIVRETVETAGGVYVRSKVGGDDIKGLMREKQAVLGIEFSGHYYFQDNYYSDSGMIAVMTVAGILSRSGKTLSELAAGYLKYATADEQNFVVADPHEVIKALVTRYSDGTQDRLDGLTVEYSDWWFNVRPSNTEPLLRLNLEATSKELMEQKRGELLALIKG